jgi:hypothetical protein
VGEAANLFSLLIGNGFRLSGLGHREVLSGRNSALEQPGSA